MKYRKQHRPGSWHTTDAEDMRGFFLDIFGAGHLDEIYPDLYCEPEDEEEEYEAAALPPEIQRGIDRCAAIGYSRLGLKKPDSLIKHWGQGFLRQNIERFVRDYWDERGELPSGSHRVDTWAVDFGQEDGHA